MAGQSKDAKLHKQQKNQQYNMLTHINLSTIELYQCLTDFVSAFREYICVLRRLLANEYCADAPCKKNPTEDVGHLLDLSCIGICVDDLFNNRPIALRHNFNLIEFGLGRISLKAIYCAMPKPQTTFKKLDAKKHPTKDFYKDNILRDFTSLSLEEAWRKCNYLKKSYKGHLILHEWIDASDIPKDCTLSSIIVIHPDDFKVWERHLRHILEFRLTPFSSMLQHQLDFPNVHPYEIIILEHKHIPRARKSNQNELLSYSKIEKTLHIYYDDVMAALTPVKQEIHRRLLADGRRTKNKKAGRPPETNEDDDAILAEGWISYRNAGKRKEEYAEDRNVTKQKLIRCIDRHRKRQKKNNKR